jgi:hypothetical protein
LLWRELRELGAALLRAASASAVQPQRQLLHGGTHNDSGVGGVGGATGFVGTQILRQLLQRPDVERIDVQVRANSLAHGLRRVVESACVEQWCSERCCRKSISAG